MVEKKQEAPPAPQPMVWSCRECGRDGFCEHHGKRPEDGPCQVYPEKTMKWKERK